MMEWLDGRASRSKGRRGPGRGEVMHAPRQGRKALRRRWDDEDMTEQRHGQHEAPQNGAKRLDSRSVVHQGRGYPRWSIPVAAIRTGFDARPIPPSASAQPWHMLSLHHAPLPPQRRAPGPSDPVVALPATPRFRMPRHRNRLTSWPTIPSFPKRRTFQADRFKSRPDAKGYNG
jgi:hypothetical protein